MKNDAQQFVSGVQSCLAWSLCVGSGILHAGGIEV